MTARVRSKELIPVWEDPKTFHSSCILEMCEMIPVLQHFADIEAKSKTQRPVISVGGKTPNLRSASKGQSLTRHLALWSSVSLTYILYFSTYSGKYLVSFPHMEFLT